MSTPSEKELGELNAFLAEALFGWEWKQTGSDPVEDGYCWHDGKGKFPCDLPAYTTDAAAAMQVLERCADQRTVAVNCDKNGTWCVAFIKPAVLGACCVDDAIESETLPLAICRFARKVFET